MLKVLGRLERTRNLVIVGFAILMGVSLVMFYRPGASGSNVDPAKSTEVLASVGEYTVTAGELARMKESYRQMFGGQFNIAQFGGDERLLENLIRDRLILSEAGRLGLAVSDDEVAQQIMKNFTDASGRFMFLDQKGKIDQAKYREAIANRAGDIEQYEDQIRRQITMRKLEAYITAGVQVSEEEVQRDYKRRGLSVDVVYVPVTLDKVAAKIQPSDADLRDYYERRKTDYRILVEQKKIRYVFIEQAKAGEKIPIPDSELKTEYDNLLPQYKQKGVRVQQIVLRVARADLDESVRTKAASLVAQARGDGGTATEEKFAELAKGNSEDPASAKKGGWVDGVVKKNPNKPTDPYQRALDMTEGTITEPVKSGNSYYIIRRGPSVPKTFEDAKPELLVSMRNRKAYAVAAQLASRMVERLKETKDPQKVAQEFAAEANMNVADMVRETGFVKPGDDVEKIGSSPQFEEAIAPLNNPNDVGERTPIREGFAAPMLVEKREPRIPEFDEVRKQIEDALKKDRAKEQIEQIAKDLANSAAAAADLKAAAEKAGLEAKTKEDFKLGSPLEGAGASAAADDVIFALKAGEVSKAPVKSGDTWVVIGLTKRTEADLAEYAKTRASLVSSAVTSKRSQFFNDYLVSVRARMEREGRLKVYKDVLKKYAEPEAELGPIRGTRPNQP